jgi:nicotinamidase-related amidase
MIPNTLKRDSAGLLVIDVQDRLYPHIDRAAEVVAAQRKVIQGCRLLHLPIVVTEQYPKGLGGTIAPIRDCLEPHQTYWPKTTFNCLLNPEINKQLLSMPVSQWILIGFEAHVCVLLTAKALLQQKKEVIILNDAISSQSIYSFSTAIGEMRDIGARITCSETALFEMVADSKDPCFKQMGLLFKEEKRDCSACATSCCY